MCFVLDDEELVEDKRNSSPSAVNESLNDIDGDDDDSVSNKIHRMYQSLKDKVLGAGEPQENEAMDTENV